MQMILRLKCTVTGATVCASRQNVKIRPKRQHLYEDILQCQKRNAQVDRKFTQSIQDFSEKPQTECTGSYLEQLPQHYHLTKENYTASKSNCVRLGSMKLIVDLFKIMMFSSRSL